jgi:hypothetical protein
MDEEQARQKRKELRAEITDLALRYREDDYYSLNQFWSDLTDARNKLRKLEKEYPTIAAD